MRRWILGWLLAGVSLPGCGTADPAAQQASGLPATAGYSGMCDASAAVELEPGLFLAASDEDNVLRGYATVGGPPRFAWELPADTLGVAGLSGGERELDLEGAARAGDRVYWIGSHGRSTGGKARPMRRVLLAVHLGDEDSRPEGIEGVPYATLVEDLAAHADEDPVLAGLRLPERAERSPGRGGLNIEGLAADAGGSLLIGLRSPLTSEDRAVVLPLLNPRQVLAGESVRFGVAATLDLGGLGIRSLERLPGGGDYAVVAGPPDGGASFAVYRWSGRSDEDPVLRWSVPPSEPPFRAEALFFDSASSGLRLLSDDGALPVRGPEGVRECKRWSDRPGLQAFRGLVVPSGLSAR
jgi:hypothetical protein